MNEWIQILVVVATVFLFPAGGTDIPKIGGQKWLRRFVMSLGLGVLAAFYVPWWAALGYCATIMAFLHLGYGSKANWLYRAFIFTGYGAASLWLGWSWWSLITPPLCLLLFFLSNLTFTAKSFSWKTVELSYGFLIGICYINGILNKW